MILESHLSHHAFSCAQNIMNYSRDSGAIFQNPIDIQPDDALHALESIKLLEDYTTRTIKFMRDILEPIAKVDRKYYRIVESSTNSISLSKVLAHDEFVSRGDTRNELKVFGFNTIEDAMNFTMQDVDLTQLK